MRFAPRKQNLSTNVLLACLAFSCAATSAHATEYEGPLNADNYGNEAFGGIVTGDDEEGYTYHFDDDDQIVLGSSSGNYVVGGQWGIDLTISGKISLVADVSSNTSNTTMINGIDVWAGSEESFYTLKTDDSNINVTHSATASSGNPWIYANGINNTYGETVTGSADITAKAIGKDVYAAVALGLISQNGGTISIDGGSIEVVAENNGFAAQAIGISDEGHNVRTDKITSSGELSITSNAVNSSEDTSSRAIAYGINNANSGDDPEVSVELVDTTISAVAQAANGSAEAVGIYGGSASTTKVGEGSIYVEAVADNSESSGQAYGIYTNVGAKTLTKGWDDITVRGSSAAVGIYADDGEVSYGGGTITADISGENDDGAALGIYIGETATVSLAGDTDVNAFDALMGTGTLVVKEQTVAGFFGSVDEFTGEVLVQGITGLGMAHWKLSRIGRIRTALHSFFMRALRSQDPIRLAQMLR